MARISNRLCTKSLSLMALGAYGLVPVTYAQESETVEHQALTPAISAELRYDDNIFRSAVDELASLVTILSPGLLAVMKPGRHRLQLGYRGEFGTYAKSSADNYDDHEIQTAALLELGRRGLLDLSASFEDGHEQRGTGLSEGLGTDPGMFLSEPDEFNQAQFVSRFTYGATGTKGRLVFNAGRRELDYSNNRERTRFFDYDHTYGGTTFYFRVMPSTSLLFGIQADDFDYKVDRGLQPSLDSRERRVAFGATWEITGKSTATVRSG